LKGLAIKIALVVGCLVPGLVHAQVSFDLAGRQAQIHGSVSEGFAYSNNNNYLTMATTNGSLFTDGDANISSQITDKFRVGAQIYVRDVGKLGQWHPQLDWAFGDYRFKDWFGIRAGKVKTPLGLYSDTRDQEFLYTWALLPQSLYPTDLRSVSIAHVGGDIYGNINIKRGSLSYDAYAGSIPNDPWGGYLYGVQAQGGKLTSAIMGRTAGFDLRWNSPIPGLLLGTSLDYNHENFNGTLGASPLPLSYSTTIDRVTAFYGEYSRGNFRVDAEYRDHPRRAEITADVPGRPVVRKPGSDEPAWFISGAYRFSKWIEVGSYYSHYHVTVINPIVPVTGPGRDHIYDPVVTVRFDLARFWDLKLEGHFMDGVGSLGQAHGFYPQQNPQGLQPTTTMLVVRTGFYF
jgi:hypothetical protein